MSLLSEIVRKQYAGDGASTNFSFPYYFLDATDLDVYTVFTDGTSSYKAFVTDYDVVGAYNPLTNAYDDFSNGASVNFVAAPATGYTVVILRNNPDTQDTVIIGQSDYDPTVIEPALDKLAMMIQFLSERSARSIRMNDFDYSTFTPVLPTPITPDAGLYVSLDGTKITYGPTATTIVTDTALAVASAAAAATSASAASGSASDASSSASSASSSATTATTQAGNASSSATSASSSATSAASSATAAAASATAAAASAASVTTSFFGTGSIAETAFTIANNQSSAADVTGLLFSGSSIRSAYIEVSIYINTTSSGATELVASGKYIATYKTVAATWDITTLGFGGDDVSGYPAGINLSITSAGQVQYTSTNVTGTAGTSKMTFKATTMGV